MDSHSRIYVAGHRGLAGSAIHRELLRLGYDNLLTRSHEELDLCDEVAVDAFLSHEKPDFVFLAAAKVGGILANSNYPADFIRDNLIIQTNLIESSRNAGVKRLLFLGSSCIYPRDCPQPIKEDYLLTGPLEPTNRPYALAKIAGIEMCWSYNRQYGTRYLAAMPTNLYGPNDNFDLATSHVLPALIRKTAEAKASGANEVVVWGTGTPRREFLYSDDLAHACCFLMNLDDATLRFPADGGFTATDQHRHRRGRHHPRVGGDDRPRAGLPRHSHLRLHQARRHTAQAAGRRSATPSWLAPHHQLGTRYPTHLGSCPRSADYP